MSINYGQELDKLRTDRDNKITAMKQQMKKILKGLSKLKNNLGS